MTTKTVALTQNVVARKPRRTNAVLKKQLRDTLQNKVILIQYIIFPLIAFIMTKLVGGSMGHEGETMFAAMFAPMYAGMVPMVATAAILSEEKETHTLKVLMMAGVKHWQYMLGTGVSVLFCCALGSLAFAFMCGLTGMGFVVFFAAMLAGVVCSMLLGFAVGMLARNQMSANTLVLPVSMVCAFLPMIGMFNPTFAKISRFLYTQQLTNLLNNPGAGFTTEGLLVLAGNFVVFLAIFLLAYRREKEAN